MSEMGFMKTKDLINHVRTGVLSIKYYSGGQLVSSGSGFMVRDHLVTNNHVYQGPPNCTVHLSWQLSKQSNDRREVIIDRERFRHCLVSGSEEQAYDYAVLKVRELDQYNLYQFDIDTHDESEVGDKVVILGHPFGDLNMVAHIGYISSFRTMGPVNVIQVDGSVNNSNSGGPLVCASTKKVIGVVTRKGNGIAEQFNQLKQVLRSNIRFLDDVQKSGSIRMMGVDPLEAIKQSQAQMQVICSQLERSANVGIGYAFGMHELKEVLEHL